MKNFWVITEVDGSVDSTGPRDNGGFTTEFFMWEKGCSKMKLRVRGMVDKDGKLCLRAEFNDPVEIIRIVE